MALDFGSMTGIPRRRHGTTSRGLKHNKYDSRILLQANIVTHVRKQQKGIITSARANKTGPTEKLLRSCLKRGDSRMEKL